jgi:hypothetical protein
MASERSTASSSRRSFGQLFRRCLGSGQPAREEHGDPFWRALDRAAPERTRRRAEKAGPRGFSPTVSTHFRFVGKPVPG